MAEGSGRSDVEITNSTWQAKPGMQLILKPLTQPELGEIIVNDTLFAVGRHEEPFVGYGSTLVARLSRRHARIFEQDGVVYLADLGSLNGTTVNGRRVDKIPVKLQPGAEICFAGLCYQAEILGAAAARVAQPRAVAPAMLVLKPEHPEPGLEPIVISQFPFLVSKKSEVFDRYAARLPGQLRYLSRRHAHIFLRGENLYIEDLGSTNGTYISGTRLEEHAHPLANGDVIAFGGECFVYRVELVYQDTGVPRQQLDPTHVATQVTGIEDITRTTFVTSANSFLDIFCIDDAGADEDAAAAGAAAKDESGAPGADAVAAGWLAPLGRLRSSVREVRRALAGDAPERPRRVWPVVVAVVAVTGIALAVYMTTAAQRNIRRLIDDAEYPQAAVAANTYLETHRTDRDVIELATEAMLKATVPGWTRSVTGGDFAAARDALENARRLSTYNADAAALVESMRWVTDMEQFIAARGGPDAPIVLFEEEDKVNDLLNWWETDPNAHHRALGAIAQAVPAFVELRSQVLSHQRALQSHKDLEFAAIARLRQAVDDRLQADKAGELTAVLGDFQSRYPQIQGVTKLHGDLDRYLSIEAQIEARDWLVASENLAAAGFQTPPFRARAAYLTRNLLPGEDVLDRYRQAARAWQKGEFDLATRLLQELTATRWPEPAQRQLERNAKIKGDYERLQAARGAPGYDEQLLAFYAALEPGRDDYFLAALKDEFEAHREKALERAQHAFEDARASWQKYREKGGIGGLQRLEAGISSSFRERANLLSEAYRDASYGRRLYSLLNAGQDGQWNELYAKIANEVELQRRSLSELAMVLEPSLKQAKLKLIPDLHADPSAGQTDGMAPAESLRNR
jgi:pSer/pThr/pTyr-binding forkhead associated (FHA) protein